MDVFKSSPLSLAAASTKTERIETYSWSKVCSILVNFVFIQNLWSTNFYFGSDIFINKIYYINKLRRVSSLFKLRFKYVSPSFIAIVYFTIKNLKKNFYIGVLTFLMSKIFQKSIKFNENASGLFVLRSTRHALKQNHVYTKRL